MMRFDSIPPSKKIKRPHPGAQTLSKFPEGGEGNRSQMPHICPEYQATSIGLNIGRRINYRRGRCNKGKVFSVNNK